MLSAMMYQAYDTLTPMFCILWASLGLVNFNSITSHCEDQAVFYAAELAHRAWNGHGRWPLQSSIWLYCEHKGSTKGCLHNLFVHEDNTNNEVQVNIIHVSKMVVLIKDYQCRLVTSECSETLSEKQNKTTKTSLMTYCKHQTNEECNTLT